MIEFFDSIWQWIVENKDAIVGVITSTDFIATIGVIVSVLANKKTTKNNTTSINNMTTAVQQTSQLVSTVDEVKADAIVTKETVNDTREQVLSIERRLKEFEETMSDKINAMMEVQSIVYSTIKDDQLRNAVNSVLITAKHSGTSARAALEKEIELLKAELDATVQQIKHKTDETIDKVASVVTGVTTSEATESTHTRY